MPPTASFRRRGLRSRVIRVVMRWARWSWGRGDLAAACRAYRWAVAHGDRFWQGFASRCEAAGLHELGDTAGAVAAYRRCIAFGDRESAPAAALDLGLLLERLGDTTGAVTAYRRCVEFDHSSAAAMAAEFLGRLLEQQGDSAGAVAAYRRCIGFGDRGSASAAAEFLGRLLEREGDTSGAVAAYRTAIRLGCERRRTDASDRLADLLETQGDLVGARAARAHRDVPGKLGSALDDVQHNYSHVRSREFAPHVVSVLRHGEIVEEAAWVRQEPGFQDGYLILTSQRLLMLRDFHYPDNRSCRAEGPLPAFEYFAFDRAGISCTVDDDATKPTLVVRYGAGSGTSRVKRIAFRHARSLRHLAELLAQG
ncbi:tetratricopeptide repeat protein [Streptomyces venezuelae]|uniref:tetratricopeptide repeat protein n=1 Tax=Streptomyces venezuelae TaxID=54571 RepID=UPI00378CA57D